MKRPNIPDINPCEPHAGNIFDRIVAAASKYRADVKSEYGIQAELRRQHLERIRYAEEQRERVLEAERRLREVQAEAYERRYALNRPIIGSVNFLSVVAADAPAGDDPTPHEAPESAPR